MKRHFKFSDEQMDSLRKQKITDKDLFEFANSFDPTGKMAEVGKINLMTYIDSKGDFTQKPLFKSKIICMKIMENLDIQEQIEVHEYIGDKEDGVFK